MKSIFANAGILAVLAFLAFLAFMARLGLLAAIWIPLALALFLLLFPIYAVTSGASMLEGLFDIDLSPRLKLPLRHILVALGAFSVASAAFAMARIALLFGADRFGVTALQHWPWNTASATAHIHAWFLGGEWVSTTAVGRVIALLCLLAAPIVGTAITVSWQQNPARSLFRMIAGALLALAVCSACAWWVLQSSRGWIASIADATASLGSTWPLGPGYSGNAWSAHVAAILAFLLTFVLYSALGWFGGRSLGTPRTVPALVALLMMVLMLGWIGSSSEFFLAKWHIPLLLIIVAGALINSRIPLADHTYQMVDRAHTPAPQPGPVLMANGRKCAIVVASAGGGIQAAAWTAQVLEGLSRLIGSPFDEALCLISGISGGSMGSACYVNWLANKKTGVPPTSAASASSLDEVAWGLAWPDLWRLFFPWPFGRLIDRARAMEIAWEGNAALKNAPPQLDKPLSDWNLPVANGELPALIMSSTMVEVGGPLLLGTSDVNADGARLSVGWEDGDRLHRIGTRKMDIPVARAARLSASFPYVSPVAKPDKANQQPHMIDGGLYDNYGMATLTEWLDQALSNSKGVGRVLVLQINGFPSTPPAFPKDTSGGWVKQLIAPVTALMQVRTVGQVSHRDIELKMLQDKWLCRGVQIRDLNFDFDPTVHGGDVPSPPLSWHLMPRQVRAIAEMWNCSQIDEIKAEVQRFLAESLIV